MINRQCRPNRRRPLILNPRLLRLPLHQRMLAFLLHTARDNGQLTKDNSQLSILNSPLPTGVGQ